MPVRSTGQLADLLRHADYWRKTGLWPETRLAKAVLEEYLKATGELK